MDNPLWGLRVQAPFGVHSEHDLKEQSDAQIIVSRFPFRGNAYKVSVTRLAFCVIWHEKHSADWLAALTTKGVSCGMVHEIYDSLFFLSILLVSP